ncbi:ABC-2 type transport system ATP-binding protein [Treponema bryantii]|uniref:ABC-2 type transport system ATP-binding protein n=1 Tax=Treponema bryantii TaxID=163 RepID=A0A1H9FXL4_9SPIR|nr:ABC transporter ATP-binding protein [Treponema bryantii]SEQ42587.1 ABC-2 type transport system ATP-binding protein [Treponema bryantii]
MNLIEINGLCKNFESFQLKNVSFSLEEGYIMGFIGRNGAGKSTTLKTMLNLMKNDGGEVKLCGLSMPKDELEIKNQVGYVFGGVDFYPEAKISRITNVTKNFYHEWDDARYKVLCERFEIDQNKKFKQLSAGMKVKYSLAVAMSHNPKLLILDEPTSGLDPAARDDLVLLFQEFVEDGAHSILFSTHITSDLEKCADYITYIKQGQILASTDRDSFRESYISVAGKKDQLSPETESKIIGLHTHQLGFEGLMKTEDKALAEKCGFEIASPTLEDIMIHIERR